MLLVLLLVIVIDVCSIYFLGYSFFVPIIRYFSSWFKCFPFIHAHIIVFINISLFYLQCSNLVAMFHLTVPKCYLFTLFIGIKLAYIWGGLAFWNERLKHAFILLNVCLIITLLIGPTCLNYLFKANSYGCVISW